jgi:sec-independent protein translocase protein TatA
MFEGLLRPMHLLVIFVILMLLFPKKLGELGKGLGEGLRGLRDSLKGISEPSAAKDQAAAPDKKT